MEPADDPERIGAIRRQSHTLVHSAEELQIQIQQARERGLIGADEEKLILAPLSLTVCKYGN